MGLAGTKRRTKLSADPNNTAWSKSTDGFGHKILSAQGWKPGQLLGAVDANHAEHFTAANASHIRVVLREDNLGLGAQVGKSNADTFGLSTLSGIFGRLNGKSDADLARQESVQRDLELRSYQTRKYGSMNFVRGGVLLGDKIEDLMQDDARNTDVETTVKHSRAIEGETIQKRKGDREKRRRSENDRDRPQPAPQADYTAEPADTATDEDARPSTGPQHSEEERKAMLKAEKRERKEARRKRKAERLEAARDTSIEASPASTPTGTSTPSFAGSRHNVRQRFIQQKRLASMDARALDEILMRKTPVC